MRKYIVAQFYPIPTLFLFQLPDLEKYRFGLGLSSNHYFSWKCELSGD